MQIVRLFIQMLNILDNKKKKHDIVPYGFLPLPFILNYTNLIT